MKRLILSAIVVLSLAVVLRVNAGVAEAGIAWCIADLGPMATIAEERNSPQAATAEALVVTVPSVAISDTKDVDGDGIPDGTNPHK